MDMETRVSDFIAVKFNEIKARVPVKLDGFLTTDNKVNNSISSFEEQLSQSAAALNAGTVANDNVNNNGSANTNANTNATINASTNANANANVNANANGDTSTNADFAGVSALQQGNNGTAASSVLNETGLTIQDLAKSGFVIFPNIVRAPEEDDAGMAATGQEGSGTGKGGTGASSDTGGGAAGGGGTLDANARGGGDISDGSGGNGGSGGSNTGRIDVNGYNDGIDDVNGGYAPYGENGIYNNNQTDYGIDDYTWNAEAWNNYSSGENAATGDADWYDDGSGDGWDDDYYSGWDESWGGADGAGYDESYYDGWDGGQGIDYSDGYDSNYDNDYSSGYDNGNDNGYENSYDEIINGYDDGFDEIYDGYGEAFDGGQDAYAAAAQEDEWDYFDGLYSEQYWDPRTREDIENSIANASARYGIDQNLIRAVIARESDFTPSSLSRAGAQGLMQLMPETAASLGVNNVWDVNENINAGTSLLRNYLEKYKGDLSLALAAYNAGPGAVQRYNGVPPYKETQEYIKRVINSYTQYSAGY